MGFEDFGEVITDPYRELHPEDSAKWLRLLAVASNTDSEFYAVLRYLRETGTVLRRIRNSAGSWCRLSGRMVGKVMMNISAKPVI